MEIDLKNIKYRDIDDLSLKFEKGTITSILGAAEDLLYLLSLLERNYSGGIFLGKTKVVKENFNELNSKIGIVKKNSRCHFVKNTVKEELEFVLANHTCYQPEKRIEDTIRLIKKDNSFLYKNPMYLSDGEKTLLSLALILSYNPKIILLEDPFENLDKNNRDDLIDLLRIMKIRYHKTIIINTNDTNEAIKISDRIIIFDKEIIIDGEKFNILSDEKLLKKYNLETPEIIKFIKKANKKNIKLKNRDSIEDLMKDVYRNV